VQVGRAIFRQAISHAQRTRVVIGKDRLFDITKPCWVKPKVGCAITLANGVETDLDPNGPSNIPPCKDYEKPHCDLGRYIHFDWKEKTKGISASTPLVQGPVGFNPRT
jgi:hypothetical protein